MTPKLVHPTMHQPINVYIKKLKSLNLVWFKPLTLLWAFNLAFTKAKIIPYLLSNVYVTTNDGSQFSFALIFNHVHNTKQQISQYVFNNVSS
jgi:hypothetical protein